MGKVKNSSQMAQCSRERSAMEIRKVLGLSDGNKTLNFLASLREIKLLDRAFILIQMVLKSKERGIPPKYLK